MSARVGGQNVSIIQNDPTSFDGFDRPQRMSSFEDGLGWATSERRYNSIGKIAQEIDTRGNEFALLMIR